MPKQLANHRQSLTVCNRCRRECVPQIVDSDLAQRGFLQRLRRPEPFDHSEFVLRPKIDDFSALAATVRPRRLTSWHSTGTLAPQCLR